MAIQSQPSRIPEPFAGSGTKNTIPATNSTPSASQAASWASGFPPECSQPISAGGCPVPRNDVNGALNQITQDYAFRQDGGIWEWSALADYDTHRMVRGSDGLLYWSVAQSGPGVAAGAQAPTADDGTYWMSPMAKTVPLAAYGGALATTKWIKDLAAAEIYLDTAGSDANDGLSASTPVQTIGRALAVTETLLSDAAREGVVFHMAGGTYVEDISMSAGSIVLMLDGNVTVYGNTSLTNQAVLRVDGQQAYAFTMTGNTVVDTGSTLQIDAVSFTHGGQIGMFGNSVLTVGCPATISAAGMQAMTCYRGSFVQFKDSVSFAASDATGVLSIQTNSFVRIDGQAVFTASNISDVIILVLDAIFSSYSLVTISGSAADGIRASYGGLLYIHAGVQFASGAVSGSAISAAYGSNAYIAGDSEIHGDTCVENDYGGCINLYGGTISLYATSNAVVARHGAIRVDGANLSITSQNNSAARAFYILYQGTIVFYGNKTLSISGSYSASVVSVQDQGDFDIGTGWTVSGTASGKRYIASRGGTIYVHGSGANRIPGSTAGTADAASFAYYG